MSGIKFIFLISQPRSGSTLLQKVISKHPLVSTTGEPWMLLPIFNNALEFKVEVNQPYGAVSTEQAILASLGQLENEEEVIKRNFVKFYEEIYSDFAKQQKTTFFLDKTPRYYYIVDQLIKYFPNSKIILLYRNPVAVLSSILNTWVKNDSRFLSFYTDDLLLCPTILAKYKNQHNDQIYHLNYEEYVSSPNDTIKALCDFMGIEFLEEMIDLKGNTKPSKKWKFGDPNNVYSTKKFDKSNLDKYKKSKTAQHWRLKQEYLQKLGKETINQLGYSFNEIEEKLLQNKPSSTKLLFTKSFDTCTSEWSRKNILPLLRKKRAIKKLVENYFH